MSACIYFGHWLRIRTCVRLQHLHALHGGELSTTVSWRVSTVIFIFVRQYFLKGKGRYCTAGVGGGRRLQIASIVIRVFVPDQVQAGREYHDNKNSNTHWGGIPSRAISYMHTLPFLVYTQASTCLVPPTVLCRVGGVIFRLIILLFFAAGFCVRRRSNRFSIFFIS